MTASEFETLVKELKSTVDDIENEVKKITESVKKLGDAMKENTKELINMGLCFSKLEEKIK